MTKPGDSQTKKTIHELSKEFPEKTYRELEKLSKSQLESTEGEEQDNPTLWDIAKEHQVSYADAVPIQEDRRLKRDALKAACTLAEMRKDRTPLELMKKRAEEAEGELSIMKGIETNRVKEAQARSEQLQNQLDRSFKENNDCYNRIAEALEVNESHQKLNGKLQERLTELEEENKKMHDALNNKLDGARKAGL